jgi:hypothetical protein
MSAAVGGVPLPTYSIWGEAPVEQGTPFSIDLPIFMINSQASADNLPYPGMTEYTPPTRSGNTITNPPQAVGANLNILCSDTNDQRTCANRGLMKFHLHTGFIPTGTAISNGQNMLIRYGKFETESLNQLVFFESAAYGATAPNYVYVPRSPIYDLTYNTNSTIPITVSLDWLNKRYSFSNGTLITYPMFDCGLGRWALKLPSTTTIPSSPVSACTPGSANFWITDLGFGFY